MADWTRRALLGAGTGAAVAGAAWLLTRRPADFTTSIPDSPLGEERVETRSSVARRREVPFYTAVPYGYGSGAGLPVCLILHGASASAADFPGFGFGRFLTQAVEQGTPPFVLAGASGDRLAWRPGEDDDPQRMVRDEIPRWCAERGYDSSRLALWGWSMGGYGALLLAETYPGMFRAVAAFSPAVNDGDDVFAGVDRLRDVPVGLWCGTSDSLYPTVRLLGDRLPHRPEAGRYESGGHTRRYWNGITAEAFEFLGTHLSDG